MKNLNKIIIDACILLIRSVLYAPPEFRGTGNLAGIAQTVEQLTCNQ